jgi:hypothetical protein
MLSLYFAFGDDRDARSGEHQPKPSLLRRLVRAIQYLFSEPPRRGDWE